MREWWDDSIYTPSPGVDYRDKPCNRSGRRKAGAVRRISSIARPFHRRMRTKITLGDMLTEEQLRALTKGMIAEQRHGSRTPRSRQSTNRDEEIADICGKVQWLRHKRQAGQLKSRMPYMTQEQAAQRYERMHERLEDEREMFKVAQQQRPPQKCRKPGMRNTCVRATSGKARFYRRESSTYTSTMMFGALISGEY